MPSTDPFVEASLPRFRRRPRTSPGPPPTGLRVSCGPSTCSRCMTSLIEHLPISRDDLALTLAVVIIQGGRLVLERYGPETDADTPLVSWSMAKSITHAAMGPLVGDGRVDPDGAATVAEWADPADPRSAISTADLLAMRSGLHWVEDYVDPDASTCLAMLFGAERADMAHFAASLPLEDPVGSNFVYSSGTTNILSRMIGDAVGGNEAAMRRHLHEVVFGPLGMASAEAAL